jgi:hypothetical protein
VKRVTTEDDVNSPMLLAAGGRKGGCRVENDLAKLGLDLE